MAKVVVKARTPTSGPGSNLKPARGFTLLELMVVVALIAISTAVVSLAVPDPSATRLEREAVRLSAILESARAQARAGAMTVVWVPQAKGPDVDYQFIGLPDALQPSLRWDDRAIQAEVLGGRSIILGPEPVIGAQSVVLRLEDRQVMIRTDGLSPFAPASSQSDADLAAP